MFPVIAIPACAAVLLALLCLPRLLKDPREPVTVPEPERAAAVTAVVTEAMPSGAATRPFAYDNGLVTGPPEGGGGS